VEETQKQPPLLPRLRWWLVRRHILHQNSNVTNATAKFLWERVEHFLDDLDEVSALILHPLAQTRARSFLVAVIIFVVFIVIFFAATFVVFFFLLHFFFGWLVSKETFGSYRPIRRV
jgi:hypothetical protein